MDWNYESRRMKRNDLLAPRHTFSWGTEGNERELYSVSFPDPGIVVNESPSLNFEPLYF